MTGATREVAGVSLNVYARRMRVSLSRFSRTRMVIATAFAILLFCLSKGAEPSFPPLGTVLESNPSKAYVSTIISNWDGDTVTAYVDLGFDVILKTKLRIAHIDTPERKGKTLGEALDTQRYVCLLLSQGPFEVIPIKKEKYGRWLSEVWVTIKGKRINLSEHLISIGKARRYEGGTREQPSQDQGAVPKD
jgi:micrococcal nuclease